MNREVLKVFAHEVRISKKILAGFLAALMIFTLVPNAVSASTDINISGVQPQITGSFALSTETATSYVAPTNTFSDGSPKFYLMTQDAAKKDSTTVTYQGVDYPLTAVYLGTKIDVAANSGFFGANCTVFFDDGTYNDTASSEYTRLTNTNLSLVGLNRDANGEPKATITKSSRTDGTIERNIVMHKNVYYENLIFDGLGRNMYTNSRGQCFFFVSGVSAPFDGSAGLVMKDCIVQNVGANNSSSNRNVGINIYESKGQHNFENIKFKNIKTASTYGIVSLNGATDNYFKDLTVDGTKATSAYSVKIEFGSTVESDTGFSHFTYSNVFSHSLNLTQANTTSNVYLQDYGYKSTVLPAAYRYAQYNKTNGSTSASAINVYSAMPAISANKSVLDLADNYWVVQSGNAVTATTQLATLKTVLASVAARSASAPGASVKLISNAGTIGDAVTIPDFGSGADVNIVALAALSDSYSARALIPLGLTASITLPSANANKIKLYNFDFDKNLKYTLQEATAGVNPAAVTLTDPYESSSIAGYPKYSGYATTSTAKIANAAASNFANCKFTSLANEIEITNTVPSLAVGDSTTFTASLKDSATNSYTAAGYATGIKDTANDQTIRWYSSDPSVVSIDENTGVATVNSTGAVTIIAKAVDSSNSGEIEKPFDTYGFTTSSFSYPYTVNYYFDGVSGKTVNAKLPYGTAIPYASAPTDVDASAVGYRLAAVPATVTVSENAAANVLNVYYSDLYGYTVRYKFNGTVDFSLTDNTHTAKYGSAIPAVPLTDPKKDGKTYHLDSVDNEGGLITTDAGSNVVTYNYVSPSSYTVHYVLGFDHSKNAQSPVTESDGIYTGDTIDGISAPVIPGYTLMVGSAGAQSITVDGDPAANPNNDVYFYYVANPASYTVHYYLDGTTTKVMEDKVVTTGKTGDLVSETAPDKEGYSLKSGMSAAQSMTLKAVTEDSNPNEMVFYYVQNATQIPDETTPTSGIPTTGDNGITLPLALGMSALIALVWTAIGKRMH